MGSDHRLDRPLALGVIGFGHGHRLRRGADGSSPRFEGVVPGGERAGDRPHPAGGCSSGEDGVEVGLVRSGQRPIHGPRQGVFEREPSEIDQLLLGDAELGPRVGEIGAGGRRRHVERGAVMRIAPWRDHFHPLDRLGAAPDRRMGGRHLPVRLGDPETPAPVAGAFDGLQEGQGPRVEGGVDRRHLRAGGPTREWLEEFGEELCRIARRRVSGRGRCGCSWRRLAVCGGEPAAREQSPDKEWFHVPQAHKPAPRESIATTAARPPRRGYDGESR